jgi:oligopeptide transport system ATP-binding protein
MKPEPSLMRVRNLHKYYDAGFIFKRGRQRIGAVKDVSFDLRSNECLGLVGESGCGKSSLARLLVRLEKPDQGRILFRGADITTWGGERLRRWRRNVQIIFQDAFASLNPRMRVEEIIGDPLRNYATQNPARTLARVDELLNRVGLDPACRFRYPHEFSGGQRQRIAIARALALAPQLLICDECVANLDVSIQAQILHLIRSLKATFKLSLLFISHDLAVVKYISDRVAVMYLGKIVEILESGSLVEEALHPYTRFLLSAVPVPDPNRKIIAGRLLKGELPNPANPPTGCGFHPRCPSAKAHCGQREPQLRQLSPNHWVACHSSPSKLHAIAGHHRVRGQSQK